MERELEGRSVLIVEDDATVLSLYSTVIRKAGGRVITAVNGQEGLEKARTEHPDVILSDIMMPVSDGIQMLARIRTDPKIGQTPIVFITASLDPALQDRVAKLGVSGMLKKEMALREIIGHIAGVLAALERE